MILLPLLVCPARLWATCCDPRCGKYFKGCPTINTCYIKLRHKSPTSSARFDANSSGPSFVLHNCSTHKFPDHCTHAINPCLCDRWDVGVIQKHQTNSLSLLCSSTDPGKFFESKLAFLRTSNVSLMMEATAGIWAAGGMVFLLKSLFGVARSKEKEAQQIFAMDRSITSVTTDAPTIYSSITDAEGFTVLTRHGRKFLSSPSKQQLQSRFPPHLCRKVARVNQFDKKFLNSFHMPFGPTLDTDGTVNFVTNQHNDEQQSPPLSPSLVPQPLIPPHWCI